MALPSDSIDQEILVTELQECDVVLGRGARAREHSGTKKFHQVIREHAGQYAVASGWEQKNIIACRAMNCISKKKGRFVREINNEERERNLSLGNRPAWLEVDCETVLKKTKQSLRDTRPGKDRSASNHLAVASALDLTHFPTLPAQHRMGMPQSYGATFAPPVLPTVTVPLLPAFLPFNVGLLSQGAPLANPGLPLIPVDWSIALGQNTKSPLLAMTSGNSNVAVSPTKIRQKRSRQDGDLQPFVSGPIQPTAQLPQVLPDDNPGWRGSEHEAAEQLLALVTDTSTPHFTAEDEKREKEDLTEVEVQAVLADMFGSHCHVARKDKRQRGPEGDQLEGKKLVEVWYELDKILPRDKNAMLEAMKTAPAHEFETERLEMFLHAEHMDAKRAADRLVRYWNERRNVFGHDKFCLPMTMEGALREDRIALEAGLVQVLPGTDASGRPIMWIKMVNDTREGYSVQSSYRAIWYTFEAILEHPNAAKGIVFLSSARGMSPWGFDMERDRKVEQFVLNALPLSMCAYHGCHFPVIIRWYVVPIWLALADRDSRCRTLVHDAEDGQLLEILSTYGIFKNVIPTELRGMCALDQVGWVQRRRAEGK